MLSQGSCGAIALSLAALFGALCPVSARAVPRPSSRPQIVFAACRNPCQEDGIQQLFVARADGSSASRLTRGRRVKSVPALSPTGFRIAYDRGVENSTADAEDIYVLDLRSGRRYRLTHNPNDEETPAWSPDGSKILFVRGAWSPRAELYVMDSDGTDVVRLTYNRVAERDPAWSPDGSSIAFTVGQYTGDDLFVMAADGSSRRRLTKTPATEASPAWSPSGREIAFTRIGNGAHIISLNLVTGEETQLTRGRHGNNLSPSYSPDGARIVYSCGRRYSARNICVMRSDGAEHHRVLTSRGSVYCCPDWGGNRFGDGPLAWKVRREVVRSLRAMKVFGIARRALAALHP